MKVIDLCTNLCFLQIFIGVIIFYITCLLWDVEVPQFSCNNEGVQWLFYSTTQRESTLKTNKPFTVSRSSLQYPQSSTLKEKPMKYILMWNSAYRSKNYSFPHGQARFLINHCKIQNCFTTDDRNLFSAVDQFDAIIFHQRTTTKNDLPAVRSPRQAYIMWFIESPSYGTGFNGDHWTYFYNLTMTYREDSTFFHPYGRIYSTRAHPVEGQALEQHIEKFGLTHKHLASGKTKTIAWFVSHCHGRSGRDSFVHELQQYIKVDIYGNCGPLSCSKKNYSQCWDKVENEYKFYLSFENSICKDYVTEKFFNAMNRTIVPITFGGANYSKIAPTHSSINVIPNYLEPKDLAAYLHYLDKNDAKYAEYFWWKDYYWNSWSYYERGQAFCDLCEFLHLEPGIQNQGIHNLERWWTVDGNCTNFMHLRHKPLLRNIFL